jgi:hypothetical protein
MYCICCGCAIRFYLTGTKINSKNTDQFSVLFIFITVTVVGVFQTHTCAKSAYTVETPLTGLIGTASHLDMQKIQIIGYLFENWQKWQFGVWPFLFTICTRI